MKGRCGLWAIAVVLALAGCADRRRPANADGRLMVLPGTLDFSRVALHGTRELGVSLHNVGRGLIGVEGIRVEGPEGVYDAAFTHEGPHVLGSGSECDLTVSFSPNLADLQDAFLVIHTDSEEQRELRVPLAGVGVDARAVLSEEELRFGRIEAQSEKTRPLTFRNISDLTIDVIAHPLGPDGDEFDLPSFSLGAHEERTVDVRFAPQRVGTKDAHLVVVPCAGCGELPVRLVGEGLDRAIIAEPWALDFGQVPVDRDNKLKARLHNISTEPMTITSLALSGVDPSFTASQVTFPLVLGPDERRDFDLRYGPSHMGDAASDAMFAVTSVRNPQTKVPLRGFGGAAELCVSPNTFWFGDVPVGGKASTMVTVRNCGAADNHPLVVQAVTFGGDGTAGEDEFQAAPGQLPRTLAAGDELQIKLTFEPSRGGLAGGYLRLKTSAYSAPSVRVGINGNGVLHAQCALTITPPALDFGTVLPKAGAVLGIRVENKSPDLCAVKDIRLVDGAGRFTLPGGDIDSLLLYPGDFFTFQVAYQSPPGGGHFNGAVQIESADPKNPRFLVPLVANTQESCLVANPPFLDFGQARPDCPVPPLSINLSNQCAQPVQLNGLRIGMGTADGEFSIAGTSEPVPQELAPGEGLTVKVKYAGLVHGMNLSPLYADASGLDRPLLVPLLGESSTRMDQTDDFLQQDGSKVDVLFVVDNTESMLEEQPRLVSALPSFADAALQRGVDLHVAFTTTGIDPASATCPGGAQGGEAGRLFPVDHSSPRLLTNKTPDLAGALQTNADVGRCAFVEQGLEAVRRALSPPLVNHDDDVRTPQPNDGNKGFLRDEAALAVVFVGDEDDHSPDDVATYVRFIQGAKGLNQPQRAVVYAIAPTEQSCATSGGTGTRYAEAARMSGGEVMSICAQDYAPLLRDLAQKAFSPQDRFTLSHRPEPGSLHVFVEGSEAVAGWTYDDAANAVVFAAKPAAGARVQLRYRRACGT